MEIFEENIICHEAFRNICIEEAEEIDGLIVKEVNLRRPENKYFRPNSLIKDYPMIDLGHESKQVIYFNFLLDIDLRREVISRLKEKKQQITAKKLFDWNPLKEIIRDRFSLDTIHQTVQQSARSKLDKKMARFIPKSLKKRKSLSLYQKLSILHLLNEKNYSCMRISKILRIRYHQVYHFAKSLKKDSTSINEKGPVQEDISIDFTTYITFMSLFDKIQHDNLTGRGIYERSQQDIPALKGISYSFFYRKFLKGGDLSFKKRKIKQIEKYKNERIEQRILNSIIISRLVLEEHKLLFFDESSFCMSNNTEKYWSIKGDVSFKLVKNTTHFVKLFMIVSLTEVITFKLSFETSKGIDIFKFITASIKHLSKKAPKTEGFILVLDNAKKNRIAKIKDIPRQLNCKLLYTVPCTPQHNYIESIFLILKRRLKQFNIVSRYVS